MYCKVNDYRLLQQRSLSNKQVPLNSIHDECDSGTSNQEEIPEGPNLQLDSAEVLHTVPAAGGVCLPQLPRRLALCLGGDDGLPRPSSASLAHVAFIPSSSGVTVKAFIATTILDLASRGDRARLHGGAWGGEGSGSWKSE